MIRALSLAFYNETRKGLLLIWDYKLSMMLQIAMFGFIFVGLTFMLGDGRLDPAKATPVLVGYMVWFFASLALNDMSWNLMEETQTGTLEQMYMTIAPTGLVVLGRAFARFLFSTAMVAALGGGLMALLNMKLSLRTEVLVPFFLTLVGLYGFGFIIAGLALVFKQVGTLAGLVSNILLFVNGTLMPIDRFPGWLEAVVRTLPTTQGIVVLRRMTLEDQSLIQLWGEGSLVYLLVHSIVYLLVGWLIFKWCERVAKRKGTLGQY